MVRRIPICVTCCCHQYPTSLPAGVCCRLPDNKTFMESHCCRIQSPVPDWSIPLPIAHGTWYCRIVLSSCFILLPYCNFHWFIAIGPSSIFYLPTILVLSLWSFRDRTSGVVKHAGISVIILRESIGILHVFLITQFNLSTLKTTFNETYWGPDRIRLLTVSILHTKSIHQH